jgi:hypothetical protein
MASLALFHRPPFGLGAGLLVAVFALRPSAPEPQVRVVAVAGQLHGDCMPVPDVDRHIARPAVRDLDPKIFVRLSDVTVTRRP